MYANWDTGARLYSYVMLGFQEERKFVRRLIAPAVLVGAVEPSWG